MPKTATPAKKNQLTPDDAKAIRAILLSVADSYANATDPEEKRFGKGLVVLAAKVRRLY